MTIIRSIGSMQRYAAQARREGKRIGFVPTMGYFHEGHLSLIRKARKECDTVVVSIFVNPTQFAPGEDFDSYPRDLSRDRKLAEAEGVDVIFYPSAGQMYPENYSTFVTEEELSKYLCGASRPGHFRGVTTVVLKLFNIIQPDIAYFGQKDAQQELIIKRMVKDLNLPVKIRTVTIARDRDGLALSSRNEYLSEIQRRDALELRKALLTAKNMIDSGERSCYKIRRKMRQMIESVPSVRVDYISICDAETLRDVEKAEGRLLIALAVFFGKTRLIDNILVKTGKS